MKKILKLAGFLLALGAWFTLCVFLAATFPALIGAVAILWVLGMLGIWWAARKLGWR